MTFSKFLESEASEKPHFLLIGNPVSHSVSPLMHNTALKHHQMEAIYTAVQVDMSEIPSLSAHFNSPLFLGANITIPFKVELLQVVDELTSEAEAIGAINTIIKGNGKLIGHNTDAYGFVQPLHDINLEVFDTDRALIFGTGGATKAIIYALNDLGFEEVCLVSREPKRMDHQQDTLYCSYDTWFDYADEASLIVNATPLGMYPNIDSSPVKDDQIEFLAEKICYDIVYNPLETKFIRQAKRANGLPIGGLDMLIHQGAESFYKWTGKRFPVGLIKMKLDEHFSI
ncbi:MAG: shikimate dehydrogenase [Balneolaceae bacterium]|nr:shikimate dehydrogenase [Balneolaceae bacterium]